MYIPVNSRVTFSADKEQEPKSKRTNKNRNTHKARELHEFMC